MPIGLRYMAYGALWFSIMSVTVKLLGRRLPSMELVLARAAVTLVLSWIMLRRARVPPWGHRRGRLALRGVLGFCGLTCFYYSVVHLPLADATVIQYTNPVFTALLAGWLLRERVTIAEFGAALVCLTGVALVARPSFLFGGASALDPAVVGIALLGAISSAGAYVTVRSLGATEDPLVVVFYFPLIATPLVVPIVVPLWVWPTPWEWVGLAAIGVSTQIAQIYMTRGLQLEPAGRATAIGYLQILFAGAWGVILFAERPGWRTIAGTILILLGTLWLSTRKRPSTPRRIPEA